MYITDLLAKSLHTHKAEDVTMLQEINNANGSESEKSQHVSRQPPLNPDNIVAPSNIYISNNLYICMYNCSPLPTRGYLHNGPFRKARLT